MCAQFKQQSKLVRFLSCVPVCLFPVVNWLDNSHRHRAVRTACLDCFNAKAPTHTKPKDQSQLTRVKAGEQLTARPYNSTNEYGRRGPGGGAYGSADCKGMDSHSTGDDQEISGVASVTTPTDLKEKKSVDQIVG